jgi:proteic killer suppression protein
VSLPSSPPSRKQVARRAESSRCFQKRATIRPPEIQRAALRKLLILDAAATLGDLRVPPGNRLERLAGDRKGLYSIRINDRWRACFRWRDGDAHDVEIVDYH